MLRVEEYKHVSVFLKKKRKKSKRAKTFFTVVMQENRYLDTADNPCGRSLTNLFCFSWASNNKNQIFILL